MAAAICTGQCLCGKIEVRISGSPEFSVLCFCLDCQKISGGGHLPQSAYLRQHVVISGEPKLYSWESDAGNTVSLGNCSDCGSPIYKATSKMPEFLFVAVGVLGDHSGFENPHMAFVENCRDWDRSRALKLKGSLQ